MPKTTIIVPIYNVEKYLEKCIDSLLNQDEQDIEIILVNDGSTDSCPAICEKYAEKDSRIKVVNKENGGLGDARNAGIKAASGDYILFVDSDDYIAPDTVSNVLKRAVEHNADMVLFDFMFVDGDGKEIYTYTSNLAKEKKLDPKKNKEVLNFTPSACNKLFKKSVFDNPQMRFVPRAWYEDLRLISKIYTECSCVVYADCHPLYYYVRRDDSIMHSGNIEKTKENRIQAVKEILDFYKEKGLYDEYREELEWIVVYHGFFLPAREMLHFEGDYSSAISNLLDFMKENVSAPFKNKYFAELSRKEKIILYCIYYKLYPILRLMLKLR